MEKRIRDILSQYPEEYFDAVITLVPPYEVPVEDMADDHYDSIWNEVNRVIKPGAHIVALTDDNYDTVCCQLRMAEAEIRDTVQVFHQQDVSENQNLYNYLVKLVMPPRSGVILDPFKQNDVIEKAAEAEGHSYIGIDYVRS